MRPMTHLLYALELSAMSELLSARSKPLSTPTGSYPNVLKSLPQKYPKIYLFVHSDHTVLLLTQEIIEEILALRFRNKEGPCHFPT